MVPSKTGVKFDGLTCADDTHPSVTLINETDFIRLDLPAVSQTDQSSIQFWFKMAQRPLKASSIFRMAVPEFFSINYWLVYYDSNKLYVEPFASSSSPDQRLAFDFSPDLDDTWNWWHLACSLKVGDKFNCTLHNSQNEFTQEKQFGAGDYIKMPSMAMIAQFGYSDAKNTQGLQNALVSPHLSVKEFRYGPEL